MGNLILFGFQGAGKTTLAKWAAPLLGLTFIDTDRIIETLDGQKRTPRQIYQAIGEKEFRHLEEKAVHTLSEVNHSLISLGGGTILNPVNRFFLEKRGKLVYLDVAKEVLQKRHEGFFDFESRYCERKPLYEAISSHILPLGEKTEDEILVALREFLHGK